MSATMYFDYCGTPIGPLLLAADATGALTHLDLPHERRPTTPQPDWRRAPERFDAARRQLEAYFAGTLTAFDLPLGPRGTAFQRQVWAALCEVPYGTTASYAEIARRIGRPAAVRAVGAANGANPIGIIVPCHRVIGSNGSLTGYGGGLPMKRYLLEHERRHAPPPRLVLQG
ncbi:MAG: methylated-DNA--[protein]-cysteine S-methyltransferase [Mizugakiibacter sp.]|uniref:methylated-DNA--[protein]-cysteine S-methyltransferase n=1 Tax=Mizugakiibacter sp. TaxID=1972610 RepID=UPI0031C2FB12|nr:methylated-DNA--[protein]-cysteine S-methyltransferase [Xanthomonadaceae bacterium]